VTTHTCRFCDAELRLTLCDLGMSPLSNAYLTAQQLSQMEPFFPLRVYVCEACWLVQLPMHERPQQIFSSDYAYFSSYSDSWLQHAERYTVDMIARFGLGPQSRVVEVASNDGYLLRYFKSRGVGVLGIEPAGNVASAAEAQGIPTWQKFFGVAVARELRQAGQSADLLIGNNVLAHVPDLRDFVAGLKQALKPGGVITLEFPHLLQLIRQNQFDTIYHEHYSYLSLVAVQRVLESHGLAIFDVQELGTHGGSLRVYACHREDPTKPPAPGVGELLALERAAGLEHAATYHAFSAQVEETRFKLLEFLIAARRQGERVWGYGAPAKGNTLLNYCGIRSDLLGGTVDRSPHKQGKFLPGTHIEVFAPEKLAEVKPDYVLILPWNLRDEIAAQMAHVREWGGRFVVPIPAVEVLA
jgi:2-polyprenyl-3-methyl-5-hydroxy-6-metoxy-1,4-benzoquinol methylase